MKYLITLLLLLYPLAGQAQSAGAAGSASDCEKIKNDLAYNQCLASFGPKRGERAARAGGDGQWGRSGRSRSARRGRHAASFNVVSGRSGSGRVRVSHRRH